jgi:3-phosphoshikimate 1-carboxyvinyltransferase
MQRACAAALLRTGETVINHPGHSNDDQAAIELIQQMGARVSIQENKLLVSSEGVKPVSNEVNCGESGLGIRMFAPIIALSAEVITINGEGSLLKRPMDFFDEVFPQLGVSINSNDGKLPLKVKGPLKPQNIEIDGSLSSQFLTGLLMAYSKAGAKDVSIKVKNLKSRPYIDLTLDVMKKFEFDVPRNKNYQVFDFTGDSESPPSSSAGPTSTVKYVVEGDWSGGAFLLVAGAIGGNIVVEGLDPSSTQADKAIINALQQAGAKLSIQTGRIEIGPPEKALQAFHFDATECPDLFPPLVSLASYCSGKSVILGTTRLTHKESDRAKTLQEEFGKLGIGIDVDGDQMIVYGGSIRGANVHSRHDHRIAMACAVAALQAQDCTTIEEAEAINKSYPDFYQHLLQLGASVSLSVSPAPEININK